MAGSLMDYSKLKNGHPNWQKVEYFHCSMGHVVRLASWRLESPCLGRG